MGRRCAHWGGLAALGTVVAWTPVLAQTADVPLTDGVRHFTIMPQVVTTYDTNVAASDAAFAAERGLTREDVSVEPSVAIDALLPVNREAVFLDGSIGYDFYDRNTLLNRERINLAGGVSAQLARCKPQVTGSYARYQARLLELLPGPNAAQASPQNTTTQASVGLNLSCPRVEGLSPTASVTYSTYQNSSQFYEPTNNRSVSGSGGLSYARPGFGALQAYGSYTTVTYDSAFQIPFAPFLLKSDYNLYSGGVRYDRPVGSRLTGTVSVAYSSLVPDNSLRSGFSGMTYSAELNYKLSSRLDLHALVSRATLPTNQVGAAYYIDDRRQLDASYTLGARMKFMLGGFDDPQTYHGAFASQIPGLLTNERIQRLFGNVSFAMTRRLSAVLDVENERRNSNVAMYNYTSNLVSLTLKAVF